ncbi:hypothetical protein B0H14DRAFT_2704382, partial [Mycena olivaceomarginata]
ASKFLDGSLPSILSTGVNVIATTLTKVLVLHIVGLVFTIIALGCGLLALLGMPFIAECWANFFSGLAAATALVLFIFDLTAFFIIKKRVDTEAGEGIAVVGNAIWLTLVGMLLLFSTPIMFIVGRCCVR